MPSLAERVAKHMSKADAVDLAEVRARFCSIYDVSDTEALACERELKRYFALGIARPEVDHRMHSGLVDEFWHVFLVFTQRYLDFCREVFGAYIHHVPDSDTGSDAAPGETSTVAVSRATFDDFARDYARAFGEPLPQIWHRQGPPPRRPSGTR